MRSPSSPGNSPRVPPVEIYVDARSASSLPSLGLPEATAANGMNRLYKIIALTQSACASVSVRVKIQTRSAVPISMSIFIMDGIYEWFSTELGGGVRTTFISS